MPQFWEALPEVFDPISDRVTPETHDYVRELLGEDGWQQARATTLNTHYTDPSHTAAMWWARNWTRRPRGFIVVVPVWPDPGAWGLKRRGRPTRIQRGGRQCAVWEFLGVEQAYNGQHHSNHNYFIAKSLRHTAPGSYVAVMASTWTMDSQRTTARREFARYADYVGGMRLRSGAMRTSAGTELRTDVLVFRRRKPQEQPDQDRINAWIEPGEMTMTVAQGVEHTVGGVTVFRAAS